MEVIRKIINIRDKIKEYRLNGKKIGFVPTMGYLHEGHLSLVKQIREKADIVVMSIFVNPIQFGPNEDFDKYPRDFERDEALAKEAGVDIIFYPEVAEMYPSEILSYVNVEKVSDYLCGAKREGHFKGVSTVVLKLFNIVKPDFAIFGMKDAQQVRVIEKMVEDLNVDVEIVRGEIIREKDGLAMSSRNKYLNQDERQNALALRESLLFAKEIIAAGEKNAETVVQKVSEAIMKKCSTAVIDYVEIVEFSTMQPVRELSGEILIAEAVFIGKTRLIDNVLLKI